MIMDKSPDQKLRFAHRTNHANKSTKDGGDNTAVVNGWARAKSTERCQPPEFGHLDLISCNHSCSAAATEGTAMKKIRGNQNKKSDHRDYGSQQQPPASPIVTTGLATGRVPGDFDAYPYLPSSTDVPTNVPAYYSQDSPMLNNTTDHEDEPLLDLASSGTDVDHCHAASSGSGPDNTSNRRAQKQLMFATVVCFLFMVGELVGGWISGSLAIMTDAAHLLSDFTSFLISLFALWIARRPPTAKMSFGYFRAEILGAVVSVLMIWVATGILVYLAVQRVITQKFDIDGTVMLITAGCGLGINILLAVVLHFSGHTHSHGGLGHGHSHGGGHDHEDDDDDSHGHGHSHNSDRPEDKEEGRPHSIQADSINYEESEPLLAAEANGTLPQVRAVKRKHHKHKKSQGNMNVRAAFIHILGDLIQSVGVCIAAVIIIVKPTWKIADPICTFVFSILVLITTILILRDAIQVLMEGVPRHINLKDLHMDLKSLPHVKMAHGLHVWSLTTTQAAMAVHLCIDPGEDSEMILQEASQLVRTKYNITFSTIQVEHFKPEVMMYCGRCQEPKH
ncbi:zinc transporter 2-like [Patiria miniata]|uniref:Zinc transporter 2 n=1 Tax=Patiria miniata TaxID=46514 RepID=A0A914BTI2_PATMI|nr:zinc transporter 2-like [Patiria miniata]